jgi:Zn-finger nucleic acid-binding protein
MVCPRCNDQLVEVVKHGVVIDHCNACGGIWLDKGEMGKIISQIKQVESSLDEEFKPLLREKEKKEYYDKYDKYRYKQKSTLKKIFDIFD